MKVLFIGFAALALGCGLAVAADDALQTNSDALRAAVDGKKGATEIKRLALLVFAEAKKAEGPAPADADKDYWAQNAKYAQGRLRNMRSTRCIRPRSARRLRPRRSNT